MLHQLLCIRFADALASTHDAPISLQVGPGVWPHKDKDLTVVAGDQHGLFDSAWCMVSPASLPLRSRQGGEGTVWDRPSTWTK